jgi:hypothetical protein
VGNGQFFNLRVPKFRDDNRNGLQDEGEPPLQDIPFTLDLNRNGRYDAGTEPLVRTDAEGIALFTNLAAGNYSVLEVFNAPGVPNPFPIPTGPNPVTFAVPGPNAFVTPIIPTPERTDLSIDDPVTGGTGGVTASSIPNDPLNNPLPSAAALVTGSSVDGFIAADKSEGFSRFVNGDDLQRQASALIVSFLEKNSLNKKDDDLLLGAPSSGAW